MIKDPSQQLSFDCNLVSAEGFVDWLTINDSIMGGASTAKCSVNEDGLLLEGNVVEEGGGFVSCRSPVYKPPINLSKFTGLQIEVEGQGKTLKFAIGCNEGFFGLTDFFSGGVRWIASIPTNSEGKTIFNIPFNTLEPTIRAKPVTIPLKFNTSKITQFQLLYSKFGQPGRLNPDFRSGDIRILLSSISVYS